MNVGFLQLLLRWLILALGVTLATKLGIGIRCDDGATLIVVVLLLSFFNAILKPLLVLFTLPFIVVTLGLGIVVINALLFLLVGRLVEGFYVASFWSAVGGALVVSATNLIMSKLMGGPKPPRPPSTPGSPPAGRARTKSDDVIDI